ncbi:hypothetical protein ABZX40_29920 [Streptomyces sp. NPDC004610]|uniref:hypothetical protein n=1 Tax=unclassified Streptomyces TaxID=2593676 RepID=UPI0033B6977C
MTAYGEAEVPGATVDEVRAERAGLDDPKARGVHEEHGDERPHRPRSDEPRPLRSARIGIE